jgi:hypothetical protein
VNPFQNKLKRFGGIALLTWMIPVAIAFLNNSVEGLEKPTGYQNWMVIRAWRRPPKVTNQCLKSREQLTLI